MQLNLKAQQPTVRVESIAKAPDLEDKFHSIWKRYSRKDAKKHIEALNILRDDNASDEAYETELRKHLIRVEITDADDEELLLEGDDLKGIFNSTPYFTALIDSAYVSLDNIKAEKSRLGNLESLVTTLLQAQQVKSTKKPSKKRQKRA